MASTDPSTALPLGALEASSGGDGAGAHPIGDLVHQLLDAVQAVVAEAEPSASASTASLRPAEFCYELDAVISQYLEHNELSPSQYDHIQQQVVNSLAHHLSDGLHTSDLSASAPDAGHSDGSLAASLSLDHHGNADMADVLHLLDHHFSGDAHLASLDHGLTDLGSSGLPMAGHG